jgi:hypothetical protein
MQLPANIFDLQSVNITDDAIKTKWSKMTPLSIKDKVHEIHNYLYTEPDKAINEILKIKKIYGEIPILNNYLCSCYIAIDDFKSAKTIASKNYQLFPRYLFAKTNHAQLLLQEGKTDKIPNIFEGKYHLQSLYPKRKLFHFTEFLAFMGMWSVYFNKIGERDLSKTYHKAMKKVARNHPLTHNIKKQIYPSMIERILEKFIGKEKLEQIIIESKKN